MMSNRCLVTHALLGNLQYSETQCELSLVPWGASVHSLRTISLGTRICLGVFCNPSVAISLPDRCIKGRLEVK